MTVTVRVRARARVTRILRHLLAPGASQAWRKLGPGLLVFWVWGMALLAPAMAQRNLRDLPDPDPEIERRSFKVAEGFEVNLYCADPRIAKPIQMNFDPQGRLWIVSSEVYPQIKPGQTANDKVLVIEDVDGDGTAEKTGVFADGLLIPTGLAPGDGGVYVANSTELLHFQDTDGDGKADRKRVVLSGFGTEDTHHMLHTLRWLPEGRLGMNQSIYIHSHIETPHGVRRLLGGGIWNFRPETLELDVFAKGLVNPWGHQVDRWGQSFATDGAGGEGINYVFPGSVFLTSPGETRILHGLNPGSPKYCGLEIVSGRHLPDDWQGNLITNDFRGNRVCRFVLGDDGSGFAARQQADLIATSYVSFRPIDVAMGPDGAIYIADWFNPIIQHGEVDFRDERRDQTHGRIWRVTAKNRPTLPRPQLVNASETALLEALRAPEEFTRRQARRVLQERGGSKVKAPLDQWLAGLKSDDPDYESLRLQAIWVHQSIGEVNTSLLKQVLESNDPRARAAACRIVADWYDRIPEAITWLKPRAEDEHPRVRLEAVRALARIPRPQSVAVALAALDRPMDRFLDDALWRTARELAPQWISEWRGGGLHLGSTSHILFALEAVGSQQTVKPILEALRQRDISESDLQRLVAIPASAGDAADLGLLLELATRPQATNRSRAIVLEALAQAATSRPVKPSSGLDRVASLLERDDPFVRSAATRLAGLWAIEAARGRLLERTQPESTDPSLAEAIEALGRLGGPSSRDRLAVLAASKGLNANARLSAIAGLTRVDPTAAARSAADWLGQPGQAFESKGVVTAGPEALVALFVERQGGPAALSAALADRSIDPDRARLGLRAVSASGRAELALTAALAKAGKLPSGAELWSPERKSEFLGRVLAEGDVERGEAVFRRDDLGCMKCHAIAGAGGQVGPSLESIGGSAQVDYLLDSLVEPSKAIKENYHATSIATKDGRVLTGILARETDQELVLRDAEARLLTIAKTDLEDRKQAGSLMPSGLLDRLTGQERLDLVKFLSQLGKVGGLSVGRADMARWWEALAPGPAVATALGQYGLDSIASGAVPLPWVPKYSRVIGELPLAELPRVEIAPLVSRRVVRARLTVSTAGEIGLKLGAVEGLELWVDSKRVEIQREMVVPLAAGNHRLTFVVKPEVASISCELTTVPGSSAQARFQLTP